MSLTSDSGLIVVHGLALLLSYPQAQAKPPPIIWHLLGGWQVTEMCLDYRN